MAVGKARMADTGYYVEYHVDELGNVEWVSDRPMFITKDQKAQYHAFGGWTTLLWSCAPTKTAAAKTGPATTERDSQRYLFYPMYKAFTGSKFYNNEPKAPKDV